ncbi:MAG: acetylxylan esterase [Kiritimatiellae bacterium]|nr:acetylxylan esterase [Kiritimatiellia bacterium]MDD5521869.1 acetylxylan esterase [Kiritimatiellia bacterium]
MMQKLQSNKDRGAQSGENAGEHGSFHVQTVVLDWIDVLRNREVPAKIYFPKTSEGKFPLIIFSHGLGGTRQGYEYVGRHWANHGYICVHIQHRGSDNQTGRNSEKLSEEIIQAVKSMDNFINRPKDVSFAIDQMERLNTDKNSEFYNRIDMEKIGVAGHSFGGYTAHTSSGRKIQGQDGMLDLSDKRIKACIAMSAPASDTEEFRKSFGSFKKPCLHITGLHDVSPIKGTRAEERRLPFDSIKSKDQYLVIFHDADHMVFTGKVWPGRDAAIDREIHRLVRTSTTMFWDVYLKEDKDAKNLFMNGGLDFILSASARVERK